MTLTETLTALTATAAAAALSLSALTNIIDSVHDGAWSKAKSCVTDTILMSGQTTEHVIDGYLTGTIDQNIKSAVDACVSPLVDTPDPLRHLPADIASELGINTEARV